MFMLNSSRDRKWPLTLFYVLIVLFLLFPIMIVLPISFSNSRFMTFPPPEFGLRWYREYFNDPIWMDATWRSLRIATGASIVSTLFGTLSVLGLAKVNIRVAGTLTALFVAPAIIPNIIIALGVFVLVIRLGLTDNEVTLMAAHAALGLPFVTLIVGAAYRQIDPSLERAARILGAGPARAFLTATLPPLTPAIFAALIFAFFVSFDELIVALFLMSGAQTLPTRIWNDLLFEINPTVAAVSVFFIFITTLAMTLAEILRRRGEKQNAS
jgi:putative spermidine/putrescine transport system permease protein